MISKSLYDNPRSPVHTVPEEGRLPGSRKREALCAATGDCWQTGGLRGKGPNLSAGRVHKDVTNLYKDVIIFQSKKMHKSVHFRDNFEGGWPVHPGQYTFKK